LLLIATHDVKEDKQGTNLAKHERKTAGANISYRRKSFDATKIYKRFTSPVMVSDVTTHPQPYHIRIGYAILQRYIVRKEVHVRFTRYIYIFGKLPKS